MNAAFFKKWTAASLALWAFLQPLSIAGANIAIALILTGLIGRRLQAAEFPSPRAPLEKPLWIYWLTAVFVSAAGVAPRASFGEIGKEAQMIWDFYIFSAAFALAPAAAVLGPGSAACFLASAIGVLQFWAWHHPGRISAWMSRAAASSRFWNWLAPNYRAHAAIHPVTYGELMGLALLGGLAYCAAARRGGKSPGIWARAFCLASAAGLALSLTRGALAGVAAGFLLLIFLGELRRILPETLGLAALALGAVRFLKPAGIGRMAAFNAHESSAAIHLALWKTAWRMFLDRPLLGAGLSNYNTLFGRYHSLPFAGEPSWGNAHNLYLMQLAERGLAGFCALALVLGAMVYQAWTRWRLRPSFQSLWFLSWMAAFLIMNLTESAWQVGMVWMPTLALYCWMEKTS
ncbi:MAG: O-antigen ligase family protein [Elusimicrobiota bacterium]